MTSASTCISCSTPKAHLVCGLCETAVCKSCAEFAPDEGFTFLTAIPAELEKDAYCRFCYDAKVEPELVKYQATIEAAKKVFIFFKDQSKLTRLMKKNEKPLKVKDCRDKNEALLRLAFQAVGLGFNAVVDVNLVTEKVRMGTYQTQKFHAQGIPTQVSAERYNRD